MDIIFDIDDTLANNKHREHHFLDGYNPVLVFDDRDRVVKMWRRLGLVCCQVADGGF